MTVPSFRTTPASSRLLSTALSQTRPRSNRCAGEVDVAKSMSDRHTPNWSCQLINQTDNWLRSCDVALLVKRFRSWCLSVSLCLCLSVCFSPCVSLFLCLFLPPYLPPLTPPTPISVCFSLWLTHSLSLSLSLSVA